MDTDAPGIRAALENEMHDGIVVRFAEQASDRETWKQAQQRIKESQHVNRRKMHRRLRVYPRERE